MVVETFAEEIETNAMAFPKQTQEYAHLKPVEDPRPTCYGPLQNEAYGIYLGVNLLGDAKVCSWNCVYCNLGPTEIRLNQLRTEVRLPSVPELDSAVREKLRTLNTRKTSLDRILVSGMGEPTLHPDFLEMVKVLERARNELHPKAKLTLLSNGSHLDQREVQDGTNLFDERVLKIDAGNEAMYKEINSPLSRAAHRKLVSKLRAQKGLVVQSFFVQGAIDNTTDQHLEEWLELVGLVQPERVIIHTLIHPPWSEGLQRPSEDTLFSIAAKLKRKLQVESLVLV